MRGEGGATPVPYVTPAAAVAAIGRTPRARQADEQVAVLLIT